MYFRPDHVYFFLRDAHEYHYLVPYYFFNFISFSLQVITLNSISIIVAEYIPFGANQIVQLNSNVGSTERVQGGFISPAVDDRAAGKYNGIEIIISNSLCVCDGCIYGFYLCLFTTVFVFICM